MEEEHRPGKKSAMATASLNDDGDDVVSEEEVRKGLRKALEHKAERKKTNVILSPERRDELLQDSFPMLHPAEGGAKVKELTRAEYAALRSSLQKVVREDVHKKIVLLRKQLSEYHSVLEDCIAFKDRCERLEQEKKDLMARSREVLRLRDRKIAMLENELALLRNECCRGSNSSSNSHRNINSDWVSSIINGGSENGGSEDHPHPTLSLALPSTEMLQRMNNNSSSHQCDIYENESRRTITVSPSSIKTMPQASRSDSAFNTGAGAIRPLPFPGQLASPTSMHPQVNQQQGAFPCPPCGDEVRSSKRRKFS